MIMGGGWGGGWYRVAAIARVIGLEIPTKGSAGSKKEGSEPALLRSWAASSVPHSRDDNLAIEYLPSTAVLCNVTVSTYCIHVSIVTRMVDSHYQKRTQDFI